MLLWANSRYWLTWLRTMILKTIKGRDKILKGCNIALRWKYDMLDWELSSKLPEGQVKYMLPTPEDCVSVMRMMGGQS